jgi:hypothetical protein
VQAWVQVLHPIAIDVCDYSDSLSSTLSHRDRPPDVLPAI